MEDTERRSRTRVNIERTASGKVVRGITYEHVAGEQYGKTEAAKDVEDAVNLFIDLELHLSKNDLA